MIKFQESQVPYKIPYIIDVYYYSTPFYGHETKLIPNALGLRHKIKSTNTPLVTFKKHFKRRYQNILYVMLYDIYLMVRLC